MGDEDFKNELLSDFRSQCESKLLTQESEKQELLTKIASMESEMKKFSAKVDNKRTDFQKQLEELNRQMDRRGNLLKEKEEAYKKLFAEWQNYRTMHLNLELIMDSLK